MYWDVKSVKPLSDYRIYVEIQDGRKGIFDLKPYLDHGVFREFRDLHYFNRVGILFGAVTWPNDQGIAPETLLAEMLPLEPTNSPNESLKRDAPDAGRGESSSRDQDRTRPAKRKGIRHNGSDVHRCSAFIGHVIQIASGIGYT